MKNGDYILIKPPVDYTGPVNSRGYCYEHQYIWWLNTGEILTYNDIIHHKDENKINNCFENLEKCSRSEHPLLHPPGYNIGVFKCPVCDEIFEREERKVKHLMKKNKPALCSRQCGGKIYGKGLNSEFEFEVLEWKRK